jgi:hypothetical protein
MFTIMTYFGAKTMSRNGPIPTGIYSPYEVAKCLPGKPIKFVCQSKEWEDVETHWYGRHSVRCPRPAFCQLCHDRHDVAWKAYLLGTAPAGGVTAIFQLTPLAASTLKEWADLPRGLLGAIIVLTRKGTRDNGPLTAELRGWCDHVTERPYERLERVVKVLYKQYGDLKALKA